MSNKDQQHPEGSPSGAESVALLPGAPSCFIPVFVRLGSVCVAIGSGAPVRACVTCDYAMRVRS